MASATVTRTRALPWLDVFEARLVGPSEFLWSEFLWAWHLANKEGPRTLDT